LLVGKITIRVNRMTDANSTPATNNHHIAVEFDSRGLRSLAVPQAESLTDWTGWAATRRGYNGCRFSSESDQQN
jgi:hypothetical protein